MLRRTGIPAALLMAMLLLIIPSHANAAVRFGMYLGAPAYTPYVYSYPYPHYYYYGYPPYPYPTYMYPHNDWRVYRYREHHRHERRAHAYYRRHR